MKGMVPVATWHEQMAEAVNLRKKAINGVQRWQKKIHEAEEMIEQLSTKRQELEDGPVPAAVIDDTVISEMQPLFGITTQ